MNTIKLTIRGVPVEVTSPADAFELIRLSEEADTSADRATAKNKGNGHQSAPPGTQSPHITDPQFLRLTADFLRAIQSGGQNGVTTDRIITALSVPHGRAVGGRLAIINKLLEGRQLQPREIYSNKKTANGRIWKPRRGIDAAISSIDQQLKNLQ